MVRTKADAYVKASVKAPRKNTVLRGESSKASTAKGGKPDKYAGGNLYCPRPTPPWQKPITSFFSKNGSSDETNGKHECMEVGPSCSSNKEQTPGCSKDNEPVLTTDKSDEELVPRNKKKEPAAKAIVDDDEPVAEAMVDESAAEATVDGEEPAAEATVDGEEPAAEATLDGEEPAAEAMVDDEEPVAEANVQHDEEFGPCSSTAS